MHSGTTTDEQVLGIVASLEGAASVIEAELEVINVDLQNAEDNCRRYGEVFLAPCRYLVQLRENKKLRYREIIGELDALKVQLEASNNLLRVLGQGPAASVHTTSVLYPSSTRTVRRH